MRKTRIGASSTVSNNKRPTYNRRRYYNERMKRSEAILRQQDETEDESSTSNLSSSVSFGVVEVRQYERIAGDNPSITDIGPSLGIGWKYYDNGKKIPIDKYEENNQNNLNPTYRKRPKRLNCDTRTMILRCSCISWKDIQYSQINASKIKQQRLESIQSQGKLVDKVQSMFQSAKSKMKKRNNNNKKTNSSSSRRSISPRRKTTTTSSSSSSKTKRRIKSMSPRRTGMFNRKLQ